MSRLAALLALAAPAPARAAPVTSPITAVAKLRKSKDLGAAVKAVERACRGRLRRTLVDDPRLLAETRRLLGQDDDPEARKRGLDLHRCFSEPVFVEKLLTPGLDDEDPSVVAYAAEVAARLESEAAARQLLDRLEARLEGCTKPGLGAAEVDVCVWLTYAPGTGLAGADRALRERAGTLAARVALESPHPKAREVAVETLAATRLRAHAATVKALLDKERAGAFEAPNERALLRRFEKRRRALGREE